MLSCLVYPESHPCSKHPTKDASPERASRAEGVFSAARPPRFPITSVPLRPILCAFLVDFCSVRSSDRRAAPYLSNLFRINTYKSLSKQTTLTLFRIIYLLKTWGWGGVMVNQISPGFCGPSCHRVPELSRSYSITYKLPIFYPLCFDIHASNGGVGGSDCSRIVTHFLAPPVTCPDDLHPPYYWSQLLPPANWLRVHYSFFSLVWEGVMGKFSRSWELVKQSFAILRSDKQLMLFPVLSAIACLIVTAIIATGGAVLMLPAMTSAAAAGERFNPNQSPVFLLGMFSLYVANYFVIVFFNVALVGVANSRLMGGTWTFRDGLELAWARKGTIFQWALVAATVGVILRTLEERMGIIGRLIMRIIGVVWTLACYFVVPVLAFEDLSPIQEIGRASKLFRDTWGEKVMGGFSLGLVSLVLMLPGIGLWFAAMVLGGIKGFLIGTVLMILYFLLLSVFMSAVQGVFNAALYRYACFKQVPPAFDHDLVAAAWAPKSS